MKAFRIGQKVSWKWLNGRVEGKVVEVFYARVEKLIKTKKIVRIGTKERPAYLVKSTKGNLALKLHTELESGSKTLPGSSLANSLLG